MIRDLKLEYCLVKENAIDFNFVIFISREVSDGFACVVVHCVSFNGIGPVQGY